MQNVALVFREEEEQKTQPWKNLKNMNASGHKRMLTNRRYVHVHVPKQYSRSLGLIGSSSCLERIWDFFFLLTRYMNTATPPLETIHRTG